LLDEEQRRIRRLEALERAIIAQPPTLIFVWTKNALMPYSEANFRLRNGTANLSELRSKFSPGWQNASLHSKARK
jgi:hypothetical protein